MGIFNQKAKSGGGDVPPAGNHPAVCVAVIDLGTHLKNFKGKEYSQRDVYLVWQLTAETMPTYIGRQFSLSLGRKAALRALVSSWRGKPLADDEEFDVAKLKGAKCLLNVTHKESGDTIYARVESAAPPPKGLNVPPATVQPFIFEIGAGNYPDPNWVPWLYGKQVKEVIAESDEMDGTDPGSKDEGEVPDDSESEIPI